jgi:opacity protein-like surface antigen
MKNTLLFLALLTGLSCGAFAQESRQDVSLSAMGIFPPTAIGNGVHETPSYTLGGLASYRYMLTPRSAIEGNFGYWQNTEHFVSPSNDIRVNARNFEISGAYVFNFNYRKLNPFVEAGPAAIMSRPLLNSGTQTFDTKATTNVGALFGGGIAYEISPSFDIRAQYRGIVSKAPSYNLSNFSTGKYGITELPTIGIAYHF